MIQKILHKIRIFWSLDFRMYMLIKNNRTNNPRFATQYKINIISMFGKNPQMNVAVLPRAPIKIILNGVDTKI